MVNIYTDTIEEVKNFYADLLILQYKNKPKARETIKLCADICLGDGIVFELQDILDIDNAIGAQLDLIGRILDCSRVIQGIPIDFDFFTFQKEDANGFSTIGKLSKGYFKDATKDYTSKYSLQDDDYRLLLKFKAIANRAVATWRELDDLFYNLFGNQITITNNKDLSITYNINRDILSRGLEAVIMLGYLEPPIGIEYHINYVGEINNG